MKEKFIERALNLITIKSIVTILTTIVFCFLSVKGIISPEVFMTVFVVIIGFYFGTQAKKE